MKNIFDPEQNIHGAAQYLRFLLDLFDGNVSLALAGYNAGEGAVKKYGYAVPPTRDDQLRAKDQTAVHKLVLSVRVNGPDSRPEN